MDETDLTLARAQARVGTLLNGRWHLDRLLGVGGMAAVYAATHRNTKRVAIKILHPELSADDNARQRFLREGYAANQVGHQGAVSADDDGTTEDGVAFLIMELLEGETLEARSLRQGGTLEAREVLALMGQALATLEAAHEKGIVHRDLKPENLFLTQAGMLKVLDFGIARVAPSARTPSQTQGIMGTPSFMAPEQARGRWDDVDARTDLWAIGASMFTLLTGRFVHEAETANEALIAAGTRSAPPLASVIAVHPALGALVDRALAYQREDRFQSAAEFRAALCAVERELAGADSAPSLQVPSAALVPLKQPEPLGLTAQGMSIALRASQIEAVEPAHRRPLSRRVLPAALAVALLGVGAIGLWMGAARRATAEHPTNALAAPASAPNTAVRASVMSAPLVATGVPAASAAPQAAAARESPPAASAPPAARLATSTPQSARPTAGGARKVQKVAAQNKPRPTKSDAQLLEKRH